MPTCPSWKVEFFAFTNINNTIRLREGKLLVRALGPAGRRARARAATPLLTFCWPRCTAARLTARPAARYRQYVSSHHVSRKAHLVRQMRGRKRSRLRPGPHLRSGSHFDDLNRRFFHGLLARPQMTWSRDHARNSLGHYDPAHNAIVVSRIFDHPTGSPLRGGVHRVSRDAAPEASGKTAGQPPLRALGGVSGRGETVPATGRSKAVLEKSVKGCARPRRSVFWNDRARDFADRNHRHGDLR